MRSDVARTIADFLMSTIESEIPTTIRVFEAVPADRLDYRPDPLSKTALGLVRHLTLEDEWFLTAIADGAFGSPMDESDGCGLMTPRDAIARYRERIPAAVARVKALPDEALAREIDMFGFVRMPAVGFLSLAMRHTAHHRGQLSAYLRAMGGKVPGIYGPSADTLSTVA